MYDVSTKNKSFLRVSKQLRELGVKNNKFMLQLNNPKLIGVDPRSENLTPEEKILVYEEICTNK